MDDKDVRSEDRCDRQTGQGVPRKGQDHGKEEDEKDRSEDGRNKDDDEEYSGEDGRGKTDRTTAKTAATRKRTTNTNCWTGTTSAVDALVVAEKQG